MVRAPFRPLIACVALAELSGCTVVSAATDLATMPVRAASKAVDTGGKVVDAVTVSQSEQDARRGRELRLREERIGRLDRTYRAEALACDQGDGAACTRRDAARAELQALVEASYP